MMKPPNKYKVSADFAWAKEYSGRWIGSEGIPLDPVCCLRGSLGRVHYNGSFVSGTGAYEVQCGTHVIKIAVRDAWNEEWRDEECVS